MVQVSNSTSRDSRLPNYRLREKFASFDELPALPDTAVQILALRNKSHADASDLVALIEQDPALTVKILHYANSAYFGFRGKVESIEQAVVRIMGYDAALSIVLTVSLLSAFYRPDNFRLGLQEIRRHIIFSANLAQELALATTAKLKPGLAFAGGLLQEIGFFALAHHFPVEFRFFVRVAPVITGHSMLDIEEDVLGITHMELGETLLSHWELPEEIVSIVKNHHDESYAGDFAHYSHLVLVANRLLARISIGNENNNELPPFSMELLGLSAEAAANALERAIERESDLNRFALQFAS